MNFAAKKTLLTAIAWATLALAGSAQATTLTTFLTLSDPAANIGPGPYAKIEISQGIDAFTVNVVETMISPYLFVNTGGPHNVLTWNINGSETISVIGAPTGYALVAPAINSPWGSFEYGLDCASCQKGLVGAFAGPLSFSITSTAALDPSMFGTNAGGYYFSSDVANSRTGFTGNVATVTAVPEPETYAMLVAGLALMASVARRRQHHG